MLSPRIADQSVGVGNVLTLKLGEPEPTAKTSTELHRQADIRVRMLPTPYSADAREPRRQLANQGQLNRTFGRARGHGTGAPDSASTALQPGQVIQIQVASGEDHTDPPAGKQVAVCQDRGQRNCT